MKNRLKILFLCTGNSCRSQMAEGWAHYIKRDEIEAFSAGIKPQELDQSAVKVMAEKGIDISLHRPKHIDEFKDKQFDWVITVCNSANETCPVFPGRVKRFHVDFDDPPELSKSAGTEEKKLRHYRRVRDEIRRFVERLPGILE